MRFLRLSLLALISAPLLSQPLPFGPERPVDPPGVPAGFAPSVALGPDGGILAAWQAPENSVVVRAFTPAGHPLLSQAPAVNPNQDFPGYVPEVASVGSGRFVVLWTETGPPDGIPHVLTRLIDASGEPIGGINQIGSGSDSALAGLPSGDHVVVWRGPSGQVLARRFNAATPVTGEITVASAGTTVAVAARPDNGFVAAWQFSGAIFFRVYGPTGAPLTGPIQANVPGEGSHQLPRISTDAAGRIVVVWHLGRLPEDDRLLVRRFSSLGNPLGAAFLVHEAGNIGPPDVAARPDGSFLVLFTDAVGVDETLALARVFDSQGAPVGDAFRIHGAPSGVAGQAAADESGWVVTWVTAGGSFLRRLATTCGAGTPGLCLNDGRFRVEVAWHVPATGARGEGRPLVLSEDTGAFWFFSPDNVELTVKVLDGRGINGRFWVFYASLTDVELELTVTDRATGAHRTWRNAQGTLASQADTNAFAEGGPPLPPTLFDAHLFTPRPLAAGPELPLQSASAASPSLPQVAAREAGFAAAWTVFPLPPAVPSQVVTARGFAGSGLPLGEEQAVSSASGDPLVQGFLLLDLASGGHVALWNERSGGLGGPEIFARRVDAAGAPLGPEALLAATRFLHAGAAHASGGFVIAWTEIGTNRIVARQFTDALTPAGPEIVIGTGTSPAVASLPDGGFAVAWMALEASQTSIFLRLFAPDGTPRGPARAVPETEGFDSYPLLAADAAGRLVVVWTRLTSYDPEPTLSQVRARLFSADGQPGSRDILVRPEALFTVDAPRDVAMRSDGSFLILFDHFAKDRFDRPAAVAHVYDPEGRPAGAPFPVHDGEEVPQEAGNVEATADGWLVSWRRGRANLVQTLHARHLTSTCGSGEPGLCLNGGRFRVEATWRVPRTGQSGTASPVVLADDTGTFWFFDPENTELIVKVLDGRAVNGHFWVFYGSLTDIQFDLIVTDTVTGQRRTYHNPAGTLASRADTEAF